MSRDCNVQMHFHPPCAALRPFITTFYHVVWQVPPGETVVDYLLPEWSNLRFHSGSLPVAETFDGQRVGPTNLPVTGPSSKAIRFEVGTSQLFGVGLLPLGWAKFIGLSAADWADRVIDGNSHPAFADFRGLTARLHAPDVNIAQGFALLEKHFLAKLDVPLPRHARIAAIHAALIDSDTQSVSDISRLSGVCQRTVERACQRDFGFSPKRLLRRQRFMRSLTEFLLDPSLRWIGAIDCQYHDQAQFVHDFRQFMGMSPSHYASIDKPLTISVLKARARLAGTPLQKLIPPGGMLAPKT